MTIRLPFRFFTLMLFLLVAACTSTAPAPRERYFWPPPPDIPRIEWIKAYSSQLDIEKSSTQRFWAAIAGNDQPVSLVKPVEVKSIPALKRFYVSDLGRAAVVVFDMGRHEQRSLEVPQNAPPILHPLSIVADRDNNLYLLERRSASILVFNESEQYQRAISLKAVSISTPVAMAIDPKKGFLYVADAASHKIGILDLQGESRGSIGAGGEADGQFNLPIAIAVNSKGQIIVADAFSARIQVFDADGTYRIKFGRRGDAAGDFQLIKSVAVDSNDNIYVVDGRSHTISIFNPQAELLLSLGGYYAVAESGKLAPGGFALPVSIDIDATDRLYVVDQLNARIQVFQYLSDAYRRNISTQ